MATSQYKSTVKKGKLTTYNVVSEGKTLEKVAENAVKNFTRFQEPECTVGTYIVIIEEVDGSQIKAKPQFKVTIELIKKYSFTSSQL